MGIMPKYLALISIAPLTVLIDQGTKNLIEDKFRLGESLPVISGFFDLTHIRNYGVAFGMLSGMREQSGIPLLTIVPVLVVGLMLFFFKKLPEKDLKQAVPFSLILGGAVGNIWDRLGQGFVTDFLDFHWMGKARYPAFNFADIAICTGVGILFIFSFFQKTVRPVHQQSKKSRGKMRK